MNFRVHCSCGLCPTVSEAAAGGETRCACGRDVPVPSWTELRVRAGPPPYNISPELLIENLLSTGELPYDERCARCEKETDRIAHIQTECEKAWVRKSGGVSWATVLLAMLVRVWVWEPREERVYGRDKIYRLPLRLCDACRPALRSQEDIKLALRSVPAYDLLLEKFPEARVSLESP